MNNKRSDFLVIGFALFSMFLGAGNLIFPPLLGRNLGADYYLGIIGFIITGVGVPLLGILSSMRVNGKFELFGDKVGKKFSLIYSIALFILIGPLLAIPRTAATTFELAFAPNFANINYFAVIVVYFLVNLIFVLKPSKVIDVLGKFLTPILLAILFFLIAKGVLSPIDALTKSYTPDALSTSLLEGYQTMDAIAAVIFSSIILGSIKAKGYTGKASFKLLIKAAVIAIGGLAIIYGGLIFLGAHTGDLALDSSNSQLLLFVAESILGHAGAILIGVSMALACLTTSIGLLSAGGSFFERVSNGKLPYKFNVLLMTVTSILVASMGLDKIISLSATLLGVIYPVTIVLILLNLFHKRITNPLTHKVTVYVTLVVSILITLGNFIPGVENLVSLLPLYSKGFGWVVPALVGFIIPSIIPTRETATA
ncbi:branched-chain amino acid transport system II carrier protein [Clostridium perfringens]|uniref:branched-chain amino acid transport system II carrier protein n=1 Tax=Clostridium perfringens TaxID=1502 RepID=UPI001A1CF20F|nr:branched-chain amino acid transport system II carrier protein [Clostridium perfringens]MDK0410596.1 branched-chain amino acid transport system II carrier protein [Clostridium perfringens]MDK0444850.1 branched-chain amino acid transport system II carrier protein [Clostridium perfringens]MDK0498581.1 branched-chain amino acid transport system II carrier protein [Clostridium perfringens]MDK0501501.1 branched-chain amino acid transport system II carrier protein [Clostridium perfringens]